MLPRLNRLTFRHDFNRVYRYGRPVNAPPVLIRYRAGRATGPPRVGVVVSNRIAKRATDRNRLKRIIRGAVQPALRSLPAGLDLIVTMTKAAPTLRTLRLALAHGLEQLVRRLNRPR